MGPLAAMFGEIRRENDADYAKHGHGMDRKVFNSRLSKLSNKFYAPAHDPEEATPIVLDSGHVTLPPMGRWAHAGGFTANPTPPFRLPTDQAGPAPPVGPLATMLGKR